MSDTMLTLLLACMSCFTVVLTISLAPEAAHVVIDFLKIFFRKDDK